LTEPPKLVGPDRGGGAGAAVKIGPADPLGREEDPGVVCGGVGVVERNAVEGHGVLAVGEAAEISLAVAEARTVGLTLKVQEP